MDRLQEIADGKGVSAAQLCLAWVLARGEHIVPIPGTTNPANLEENAAATEVTLSAGELTQLDEAAPKGAAAGLRYIQNRWRSGGFTRTTRKTAPGL